MHSHVCKQGVQGSSVPVVKVHSRLSSSELLANRLFGSKNWPPTDVTTPRLMQTSRWSGEHTYVRALVHGGGVIPANYTITQHLTWEGRKSFTLAPPHLYSVTTHTSEISWGTNLDTHTHTHYEEDRKINTDHMASCFGPITPLWSRMWGDSWQAALSHSHASQNDWWIPPFLPLPSLYSSCTPLPHHTHTLPLPGSEGRRMTLYRRGLYANEISDPLLTPLRSFANPCVMDKRDRRQNLTRAGGLERGA